MTATQFPIHAAGGGDIATHQLHGAVPVKRFDKGDRIVHKFVTSIVLLERTTIPAPERPAKLSKRAADRAISSQETSRR